jgi:hypothetical protein
MWRRWTTLGPQNRARASRLQTAWYRCESESRFKMEIATQMSPDHWRFLLIEQGVGAAIVNLAIAVPFGWLFFRNLDRVPIWGSQSVVGDTLATALLLPLITCLIVTPLARRSVRNGRFPMLEAGMVYRWLPQGALLRAVVIGLVCLAISSPIILLVLSNVGVPSFSFRYFLIFKMAFSAAEGGLITPMIALMAISGTAENESSSSIAG